MPTLYLIRHAQPKVPEYDNRYPGPDLGELGIQQAQWIANALQTKGIQQIYASNYPRVMQTLAPLNPTIRIQTTEALWEREPTIETHESLVERVHRWFSLNQSEIQNTNTAIFSHCGPINMILEYLDPQKTQLDYPFTSPHGCLTPCAGIWEIHFTTTGIEGRLITPNC
jgi:broad specificity phosphatase PhoE